MYDNRWLTKPKNGTQINKTHSLTTGCVGHWPLIDKGTVSRSMTGINNNLIVNGTIGNNFWAGSPLGGGALLNGSNNYFSVTDTAYGNFTSEDFSLSIWFNTATTSGGPIIFYKGDFNVNGYYVQIGTNATIDISTNQAATRQISFTANNAVVVNTWYHLVIVRRGTSIRIYLNGSDVTGTAASHSNPTTSTSEFRIGAYSSGLFFTGFLDFPRVYNRALTIQEVMMLRINPNIDFMNNRSLIL